MEYKKTRRLRIKTLAGIVVYLMLVFAGTASLAEGPDYSIQGSVWGDVYFDAGSAALADKSKKELDEVAGWIKKHPGAMVLLAGYDDQRTPEEKSVELGWKRAEAVKDCLASLGVAADSINTISFGNTKVAYQGSGEDAWARNRRVRYRVVETSDTGKMEGKPNGVCQRCKR